MRKALPTITESAAELQQWMHREKDGKKRQRWHALYLAASGHARHRQAIATLLGVHRHSVAAWFAAYAAGGIAQALRYQVSTPPVHRRMTEPALRALQDNLRDPQGFPGYNQLRVWLAEEHHVTLSYSSVHALVRYKLRAKPKRPRPSHAKKAPKR
jgi:transposase